MAQNVLITAGASGIGLAMANAFLATGAQVAITDIDDEALSLAASQQPDLLTYQGDAANQNDMKAVFSDLQERWDRLDVLQANAGIAGVTAPIEDVSLVDWQRCIAVNLDGAFISANAAVAWMKNTGTGGVITMTSSTAGLFGYPLRSAYAAAKWGIIGLTKTLAMELGAHQIRVNAICPGSVKGQRMDGVIEREANARGISAESLYQGYLDCSSLKSFSEAEDIAAMAVFLASNSAKNISGMAIAVDGNTEKVTL